MWMGIGDPREIVLIHRPAAATIMNINSSFIIYKLHLRSEMLPPKSNVDCTNPGQPVPSSSTTWDNRMQTS